MRTNVRFIIDIQLLTGGMLMSIEEVVGQVLPESKRSVAVDKLQLAPSIFVGEQEFCRFLDHFLDIRVGKIDP